VGIRSGYPDDDFLPAVAPSGTCDVRLGFLSFVLCAPANDERMRQDRPRRAESG
jgi:hypothetical protein